MKALIVLIAAAWFYLTYGDRIDSALAELQNDRLVVNAYLEKIGLK